MTKKVAASTQLYLERLHQYLKDNYSEKEGLWNYSSRNTLGDDWLLATPFNIFGVPYTDFKQAVLGDYPLFKLSSQDAAGLTQQSVPVLATITKPGARPVKLLEGHSYRLYDEMYSVMINAKIFLDITTLTPPTDRFLAALTNALTYISNKPEDQRPIVRILYSNWAANLAGFPDLHLDASIFLKDILQNVDPAKKLTVYAGAINAGPEKGITAWVTSWNHSKIVAADGQSAIVGGHNMWGEHYLGKNPVFDVSMKIQGESATHAQDYADKLWGYVLWRINESPFNKALQKNGTHSLVHTAAYTYDTDSSTSTIAKSYKIKGDAFVPNLKGQPAHNVYKLAKAAFTQQSGSIPILSIGREAGMDLSHLSTDRNSYLNEEGEPADQSMYQLFSMAQNKIRMSLQSFSLASILAPFEWFVVTWDYTLFLELAKAVRRGVTIEVVLSNPNAIAGGLSKTEAPYDGEYVENVNKRLRDVLIREFYLSLIEAEALVAQRFLVANFRFSQDDMYPDSEDAPLVPLSNHAKTFMVDDRLFYIGSQNQYRCNLAEFGYLVEDATVARSYIDNYWTKLWDQSKRTLDPIYDGSLEKFQNAEGTAFILDLLNNKRLDKTWQKAIKDYANAATDPKAPYLATLNDIISNAGYQTTADAVIDLTKTPFFTNDRPNNQPNDESDRFVKDLFQQKDLLVDFAELIVSIYDGVADSDTAVNQFLKNKKYGCTVLQVYASFVGIRGNNLNYFKGEYVGPVMQDGGEAFDFRTLAERAKEKPDLRQRLLSEDPSLGQMQQNLVLLIESDQSVKLDSVALLKPTYADDVLTWNEADGNATSGSITFSEIPRPGLKDPFVGVECFGEITYPDGGTPLLQGKVSFYARKEAIKDSKKPDPVVSPVGRPSDWPAIIFVLLGIGLVGGGAYLARDRWSRRNPDGQRKYSEQVKNWVSENPSGIEMRKLNNDVAKRINEPNTEERSGWAFAGEQGKIKKFVDHCVTQESASIEMNKIQSTFEEQFSALVAASMTENDFSRESSQVVDDILKSDFRNLVRENLNSAFRDQIGQAVIKSMTKQWGNRDYKVYAADSIGLYLDASITNELSEPMMDRMRTTGTRGSQSYIKSLLTAEVVACKANYLQTPENKLALQEQVSNQLSDIIDSQRQTSTEKQAARIALEQAKNDLNLKPLKENQDRVEVLTKQVNKIAETEEKLKKEYDEAKAREAELDADILNKKQEEAKDEAERREVFRYIE